MFSTTILALVVATATSAVAINSTVHITNTYSNVEPKAYPLMREGHVRHSGYDSCVDHPECKRIAKQTRMTKLMEEKTKAHNECVQASECPINRLFSQNQKCVNGKAGQYDCNNVDLLSYVPIAELGSTYDASDSWGWYDAQEKKEIAIIGMMDGTSFVDISNPTEPNVLGFLPQTGTTKVIWADMKVYADHVFIVRESRNHGMQVFDLTKLRQYYGKVTQHLPQLEQDAFYDEVTSTHNIVINEETGFAYLVGAKTCSGGLHMVDISTPLKPTFAGCFSEDGYTHDAQCVIYSGPDKAYKGKEICFNYNEDTLTIVDVSDKSKPTMLSRVPYDLAYYTHQGWLNTAQTHLLLNDELDEQNGPNKHTRTMIWDVSTLTKPELIGSHYAENEAIDHNLYIHNDYGYLTNYCDGLRVLDARNMGTAKTPEVAFFDVADYCDDVSFKGSWSNYPYFPSGSVVVSSIELGLFVLKVNIP